MIRAAPDLTLYLVTDPVLCADQGVEATVTESVGAGVTAVQLRDTDASDPEVVALGRRLRAALSGTGVPLLVNDRVHLVEAIGADGAHVGQGDLDPVTARTLIGPCRTLGLSVHRVDQVERARALPPGTVDYLGVGPVWTQRTKQDAAPPVSAEGLARIVEASPWPCVAIGGVDANRVAAVRRTGAAGMAVVSAICGRGDVGAATRGLRESWGRHG